MDFSISQFIQLGIGITAGLILFTATLVAKPRLILIILLLIIPFQPIMTRYGSFNMVLIYMVAAAFLIKGRIRSWPLGWPVCFLILAYLMSLSQAIPATYMDHIYYLLAIGGNLLIFYIVYNYFRQEGDIRFALSIFLWISFFVVVYFALSLFIGFEQFSLFGVDELSMTSNLERKRRLIGPFQAAEISSDFLALQVLLIGYAMLFESRWWHRIALLSLMVACFGFLVATGSRGGFIGMVIGALFFLLFFRKILGSKTILRIGIASMLMTLVALIVVNVTEFDVLFDRLENTKFEGFVPDTRLGLFEMTMERVYEKPIFGHGPRFRLIDEEGRRIQGYRPLEKNPHNLYLFVAYTLGLVGFFAYTIFFIGLILRWRKGWRLIERDSMQSGIPRLALLLIAVFLITEYRIEFLRFVLNDFQNYMFALWGMLLAFSDRIRLDSRKMVRREY